LLNRACFLIAIAYVCLLAASADSPVVGRWSARAPDPIGRTEQLELRFVISNSELSGTMHTEDGDIPMSNLHLQGRLVKFEATRDSRGHRERFHYDGVVSGNTIDFTVQNDDGSNFFRFLARREE